MLKRLAVLFFTFLVACCVAYDPVVKEPAPESELKKVVERFDAVNNPNKIQCRTFYAKYSAAVPNMQMRMQLETYTDAEKGRISTAVFMPGMPPMVELYDGRKAYSIIPGIQTRVLEGEEAAFWRYSARYTKPWLCLSHDFEKMVLDKKSYDLNGKKCYRLVVRPIGEPELFPMEFFIDQKTFYPVQHREMRQTAQGKIPNTVSYIKFRKYNGALVVQTMKIEQLKISLMADLQELKVDCPVPDKLFNAEMIADEKD